MKYKFTEEKVPEETPSQNEVSKIDSSVNESVNEEVLKLVRISKLVQIGLTHEQMEGIKPIEIRGLRPPSAPKSVYKPLYKPKPRNLGTSILKILKIIENPNLGKGNLLKEMTNSHPLFLKGKFLTSFKMKFFIMGYVLKTI